MRILFFDDEKIRYDIFKTRFDPVVTTVIYCQTMKECQDRLQSHIDGKEFFDIIHFDHDIQDLNTFQWYSSTGLAEWFVQTCPADRKPTMGVIHSVNQTGCWNLYHIFSKLTKTFMVPFRVDTNEYAAALAAIKEENDVKIQNSKEKLSNER